MSPTAQIIDQGERQQAIHPGHSVIIQAPAGSGKTELLIQRYLRLLALVDEPEEIIAITFTRKAATEMQGRVIAALVLAQQGPQPEQRHQQITRRLAAAALQRDTLHNWNIIKNPSRLRIQTIDSLSANLSRQLPILSRLGAQLEISDDTDTLYEQAATNTLAELEGDTPHAEAIATLLMHLDNDLPRLQALTVAMLKKRDQWLRYITKTHDRAGFEHVLRSIIEASLEQLAKQFPTAQAAELCQIMHYAAQHLQQDKNSSHISHCLSITALPGSRLEDWDQWLGIAELVLTKENSWRRSFNKKNGFPTAGQDESVDPKMKQRAQHLITCLSKHENIRQHLLAIKILPAPNYTDNEWQVVSALCTYLLIAEAQLRLCFAEHRQIDYIGVAQAAITALGEEDMPTDLALYLDYQIRHLLVDEFQDISLNQQQLLLALCNGWSADEGRSLFFVGDPMQSIYRFREAEVNIFTNTFQQQRFGSMPLIALKLSTNFRSAAAIIDWVNKCFSNIFPPQNDIYTGAVSYTATNATYEAETAAVHVYPFFSEADVSEAQTVLDIINTIKERQDQRIAILTRNRSHIRQLIPLLKRAGIAVHAVEIEPLGQRPAIQDLLALVRAYMHPADRIAWLAVLRAPWCGLRLKELHILTHGNKGATVWKLINDHNRQQQLGQDAQTRLQRLIDCFNDAFSPQQRQSLRHTIEALWMGLGGPATLTSADELDQVAAFFELIAQFDIGCNIERMEYFTEKVQQLFATPNYAATTAVQVMTIHKAKGLEFDHVIIPGLGHARRQRQNELLMWLIQPDQRYGDSLILAPIKEIGATEPEHTIYKYIKYTEQQKQHYEEARLLYVAATRARTSLHLLGHARLKKGGQHCSPTKNALLYHLWPVIGQQFEDALPSQPKHMSTAPPKLAQNQYRRLTTGWQRPAPEDGAHYTGKGVFDYSGTAQATIEYEWVGTLIRHVGSVVHRLLQQIAIQGLEYWDTARIEKSAAQFSAMLRQYGVPKDELNEGCRLVCEALRKTLTDHRGRWILDKGHREQHNEYRLSGIYNGKLVHVAIDRTFIDQQHRRWIIDYKTSRHQGEDSAAFLDQEQQRHHQKLAQYGTLIQMIGDEPVWLGLYFPLLRGWRAWAL